MSAGAPVLILEDSLYNEITLVLTEIVHASPGTSRAACIQRLTFIYGVWKEGALLHYIRRCLLGQHAGVRVALTPRCVRSRGANAVYPDLPQLEDLLRPLRGLSGRATDGIPRIARHICDALQNSAAV